MKTSLHTEQDFEDYPNRLPDDLIMIHFKMVGVGPNTVSKAEGRGSEICKIVRDQPGFFLMSNGDDLRAAMHDLVDRFCDAQEGKK